MKRRTFLKSSLGSSVWMSTTLSLGSHFPRILNAAPTTSPAYDLVALKNAEPDKLFDRGIDLLGGMQGFVKKGQTVVVKPNMGWDVAPERAANTNPKPAICL
jgi:hypothetical protein